MLQNVSLGTHHKKAREFESNALLNWILSGPSSKEQLQAWKVVRKERKDQGEKLVQTVQSNIHRLQGMLEEKCEHLSYIKSLLNIRELCHDNWNLRDKHVRESLGTLLEKRQDVIQLMKSTRDTRSELKAIKDVIEEAESVDFKDEQTLTEVATAYFYDLRKRSDDGTTEMLKSLNEADARVIQAIERLLCKCTKIAGDQILKNDTWIITTIEETMKMEHRINLFAAGDFLPVMVVLLRSYVQAQLGECADRNCYKAIERCKGCSKQ